MSKKIFWILLISLIVIRMVWMVFVSLGDPSESRYALICQRMASTNNYLEPQLYMDDYKKTYVGSPFKNPLVGWVNFEGKPPLYFQTGAVFSEIFGLNHFGPRLASLVYALGILGFVFWSVKRIKSCQAAYVATILTFGSVIFYIFAGMALTDMCLTFAVVAAILSYALFDYEAPNSRAKKYYSILFMALLGVGMLAKGPVALVMAGLPIFVYTLINKKWKELKYHSWFFGVLAFLIIAVPWFYLMTKKNPDFLEYFFINENFKRFLFAEYGDKYGSGREFFRGGAIVWFLVVNLPALVLLLFPILQRKKFWSKGDWSNSLVGWSLVGCLVITGFWCLTSRVLIAYLLPTVALCSIYIACKFEDLGYLNQKKFVKFLTVLIAAALGATSAVFIGLEIGGYFKFPKRAFERMELLRKQDPKLKDAKFVFFQRTPYSSVFYLGEDKVVTMPYAEILTSPHIVVTDVLDIKKGFKFPNKPFFIEGGWYGFYPLDYETDKTMQELQK